VPPADHCVVPVFRGQLWRIWIAIELALTLSVRLPVSLLIRTLLTELVLAAVFFI
jgi:hypothetical protein